MFGGTHEGCPQRQSSGGALYQVCVVSEQKKRNLRFPLGPPWKKWLGQSPLNQQGITHALDERGRLLNVVGKSNFSVHKRAPAISYESYHSEARIAAQVLQQRRVPIFAPGLQVFRERSALAGRCQMKWPNRPRTQLRAVLVMPPGTGHSQSEKHLNSCQWYQSHKSHDHPPDDAQLASFIVKNSISIAASSIKAAREGACSTVLRVLQCSHHRWPHWSHMPPEKGDHCAGQQIYQVSR